jgi:hypothetical protein
MSRLVYGMGLAALVLVGCHTITEELPTQPSETPKAPASGILKVSIPALPAATPTPKPSTAPTPTPAPGPTPTPAPAPTPTPQPPGESGCGNPLPPPIFRMGAKIHIRGPNRYTLDVTPQVHDQAYCEKIGFVGRLDCPVRPEGAPDRLACEIYAIGYAADTGRPGPSWKRNGHYCTGAPDDCENHEENQFLLYAMGSGYYEACTDDGVCGGVQVDR